MLELMKLECKKYLSGWEYFFVILLAMLGIGGSILILKDGPFYHGNELFVKALEEMPRTTASSVFIGGYTGVGLFGAEIRNSYVLPQGRRNILLSKVYIVLLFIAAIDIPTNIYKIVLFNQYEQGQWLVILSLVIVNLILAISVTSVVITLALVFKSKVFNQGSSIVAAGITYLVIDYGVLQIKNSETLINPVMQYVSIIIVISLILSIIFKMAFDRELTKDL